jgi:glyceraldehyde 3-phosphate dehydrogenase
MSIKDATNVFGWIGPNVLCDIYQEGYRKDVEVVAINDLGDAKINAHLTLYDTFHSKFVGLPKLIMIVLLLMEIKLKY